MGTHTLDVEITGQGRNLVLLHSLLSDRSSFGLVVSRLADQRRLIAVSLPGFGLSPAAGSTISDYAQSVAEMFEELALPPQTDVLGNGLGSFVALALAARHSARLDRLALIGGATIFPQAGKDTFNALAETVERQGMSVVVDIAMQRMFPQDFITENPEIVDERVAILNGFDTAVFASACRALAALDLSADLEKVRNPTLIVVGTKDGATPPPLAHELAGRLANAQVTEMPGMGHCPHMQDPDAFIAAISGFLELDARA
ncbi:MAG: alpha/beta fold hydrolase [Alphaproteobacteria bacterium]|nr:alpha/beta fold hydrolase [Alphaproteobacteria bacterium]